MAAQNTAPLCARASLQGVMGKPLRCLFGGQDKSSGIRVVGQPLCTTLQSLQGWEHHPFTRDGERGIKLTLALLSVGSESPVPELGPALRGVCSPRGCWSPMQNCRFP